MPSRERVRSIGLRHADHLSRRLGSEARELRMSTGMCQQRLAGAAGVSRDWLADFEMDRLRVLDLRRVAVVFAALGQRVAVNAYRTGVAFRDAGQLRLLDRFETRLASAWHREREKVMPIAGDLRAWDEVLTGPISIGVDAETRPSDLQAIERRMAAKQRDSGVARMILLVASTDRNRALVRGHIGPVRQAFPLDTRATLAALAIGRDPGANGLVLL